MPTVIIIEQFVVVRVTSPVNNIPEDISRGNTPPYGNGIHFNTSHGITKETNNLHTNDIIMWQSEVENDLLYLFN